MYDLQDLNPIQREAVEFRDGSLLILAGAGSGKTRVLTYRVAHLIAKGVEPWNILAITFTNKAAREMRERVSTLVGSEGEGLWVATFHSACVRILRREITRLPGYTRSFIIYDMTDQLTLIRECLRELDLDEKKFVPRALLGAISDAKNKLLDVNSFQAQTQNYFEETVAEVYSKYQKKLLTNNALDFDDIIMLAVRVFRENIDVLEQYQDKFRYIMVDEYQDTNHAQYVFINLLAKKHRNICVVGDDDQSVYGWRGADVQNILDFERDYSDTKVLKLEQNYRSTQNILQAANHIVSHNINRKPKSLWTVNNEGEGLTLYKASNEHDESRNITKKIRKLMDEEGRSYSDFAILYRTNAQSRVLEEHLMKEGIPYKIYSGTKFYERMEIKDIIAYLRLVHNPADNFSLSRVVNVPKRGIGKGTLDKVQEYAQEQNMTMFESLAEIAFIEGLQAKASNSLIRFYELIVKFRQEAQQGISVTELTEKILEETGYRAALKAENTVEAQGRIENLNEFLSVTSEYDDKVQDYQHDDALEGEHMMILGGFLEQVSLVAEIDNYDETEDAVKLMTMHSAKGLEFPVVFATGFEDGIFPSNRSLLEEYQLEEERRLCYVTITRAMEKLFLSYAEQRMQYGHIQASLPSRFLKEIPEGLLIHESSYKETLGKGFGTGETGKNTTSGPRSWRERGTPVADTNPGNFHVGDKVMHPRFEQGIVMSVKGDGQDAEITVVFSGEVKKLIAAYAKLEKI